MSVYYNEIDPYCAQWLRNLVQQNLIAPGDVDERDIRDVTPSDLVSYSQCHFFAGIGGWSYALRLAGIPEDHGPLWTGSCPCQSFSQAGSQGGFADERHLWPSWFHLIEQCRPEVVLGEQVASPLALAWLDLVQADLEGAGYATAAADLCAAGVGAPHIRQRLWFAATSELGNTSATGLSFRERDRRVQREALESSERQAAERASHAGFWGAVEWLPCIDGKSRPVKSGIQPLAHGVPARASKLRAIGNSIVPQVAVEFIKAALVLDAPRSL